MAGMQGCLDDRVIALELANIAAKQGGIGDKIFI